MSKFKTTLKIFHYIDIFLTACLILLFSFISFDGFFKNTYKSFFKDEILPIISIIVLIFFIYNLLNKIILLFNYKLFYNYNFFVIKKKNYGYTSYTILGLFSVILLGFTSLWFISILIALSIWLTILLLKSKIKEKP